MKSGDFTKACDQLERSQRIDPAVGTLLYLGECYERTGRTASAWATFREAASAARTMGQEERARIGQERAEKLEGQLARLTVSVAEDNRAIADFVLRRRGQVVPPAVWNTAVPVDPGEQIVEATAPGYESFRQSVTVQAGASTLAVEVPPLRRLSTAAPSETPTTDPGTAASPAFSTTPPPDADAGTTEAGSSQRTVAYVLGAAGLVGVGVGSFFGLRAFDKNSEAEEVCPQASRCTDPAGEDLTEDARSAATISTIAFAAGGAALAAGVVLYLTAPEGAAAQSGPALSAHVGPGQLSLRGSF